MILRTIIPGNLVNAKGLAVKLVCLCLMVFLSAVVIAQVAPPVNIKLDNQGRPIGNTQTTGGDTLTQRDSNEDSITIYYRMFDSTRVKFIDSALNDYTVRYPLPGDYLYLNQLGNAARSVLFTPNPTPGYDPGFHGFDIYQFTLANTRLYNTTRPYTEFDYILGASAEQIIKLTHTQNITPLWNIAFDYRLINSPGHYKNSNSNHSNIRLSSSFATANRRYSGNFIVIRNRSKVNENGGIQSDSFLTDPNPAYDERYNIPTNLGGDVTFNENFFSSNLTTGNDYLNQTIFLRHQYDIGQKEITYGKDSAKIQKFFPRLRFQHNFHFFNRVFNYNDQAIITDADKEIYLNHFRVAAVDTPIVMNDRWQEFTNEAAIILFPEKQNQEQYLKMGAALQVLKGWFGENPESFNGTYIFGEYRNRTRNRKFDINANGKFYVTGPYSGNYTFGGTAQTNLGPKLGALQVGFQNTNRTPSFVFEQRSDFWLDGAFSAAAENWTRITGDLYISRLKLALKAKYYLITNYAYWKDFSVPEQTATLQNVLIIGGEKKFKLTRKWNLYAELYLQQSADDAINVPFLYTRNRLAYEQNLYKNLFLSTGFEVRYFSPFKADDWSPFNGQWVTQQTETISNRPDIAAFLHLRIGGFRGFLRAENLNTINFKNGFGWTNNNMAAPLYANPGLILRLGIYWSFVN